MNLRLMDVLAVNFTVLKLVGLINWSWWWVLLPVYGPVLLDCIIILIENLRTSYLKRGV